MLETLGDRLKRRRTELDLGLRATAAKIGVSPTYLSRVENNMEKNPTEEKIKALADLLQDDFDELMQLAGRVSTEVTDYIKADLNMPAFLRRAREKNISAETLMGWLEKEDTKNK